MPTPLEGIRVIDWTIWQQGPVASVMLGDLGADVIKVEERVGGDPGRGILRAQGLDLTGRPNFYFEANNRNKKSITLDLKQPAAIQIVHRLVDHADVFVQNFRPGTAERMGIGEAALRAVKADLIYVSISGFGESGPYANQPVYDPIVQALSGLASVQSDETGRPRMVRTIVPDKLTGMTAAQAITAALLGRERTGIGQHVALPPRRVAAPGEDLTQYTEPK